MSEDTTNAAAGSATVEPPPVPLRRNADFIRLWLGAGISRFGSTVGMVAYPLLALWYTGSPTATGLVSFAAALPNFLVQLPAGALVDRLDRRKLMLWCDILGGLAIASVAVAVSLGHVWIPHLMVAAFLEITRGIFYDLAERATVRNVVPPEQLSAALAQNEARGYAIGLVGQPGSALLFTIGRWIPFAFTAVADVVAVVCVLLIRRSFRPTVTGPQAKLHIEIKEGMVWLWRHKIARILSGMFAGSNLVFQVLSLAVMVIIRDNGDSPTVVGIVTAVGGIGGFCGALVAPRWNKRVSLHRTLAVGYAVWTLLVPLVAFVRSPVALAALLAGIAFVTSVFSVAAWTFQVQNTPDELQGRVNGTGRFLASGANALGALVGGFLLEKAGVTWTGVLLGGAVLLITLAVASSATLRAEAHSDGPDQTT
ncbi:MFS transporter [Solihabitans fulvus]|uniref:MFS transporter n=1 Tax=Solihabitans fulvus TaxID=1892852 RepID=A0A5B2X2Q2_9PSEU|nr:MFS transporter [Solihabitans fulvus]KAA2257567.1 MFS transporter [Solihabitans fulvus]